MKPIKFRVWTGKEMVYYKLDGVTHFNLHNTYSLNLNGNDGIPIELMPSTLKLDHFGTEIYEKDYVLYEGKQLCQVFYSEDMMSFVLNYPSENGASLYFRIHSLNHLKVLGNPYENPSLLNV